MKHVTANRVLLAVSIVLVALGLAGCPPYSGGGWIYSQAGEDAKATFGFDLNCEEGSTSGYLQYRDHGVQYTGADGKERSLGFHGEVTPTAANCSGEFDGWYAGTYTPQPPKMGEGGSFLVIVTDNGEVGPDKEDTIWVQLTGGVFDGYSHSGTLQGGNITLE